MSESIYTYHLHENLSEIFGLECKELPELSDQYLEEQLPEKNIGDCSGEMNAFYGRHHTQETKELLREINLGRKQSPETIAKRMESIGDVNPFYGKTHTKESRKVISKKAIGHTRNKKKWLLETEQGTIIVEDLTAWCKENGYSYSGMHSAYQAKRKYKNIKKIEQI